MNGKESTKKKKNGPLVPIGVTNRTKEPLVGRDAEPL